MAEKNQEANPPLDLPNEPLPRRYNEVLEPKEAKKTEWAELVGVKVEEAEKKIKEEMEGVEIQVVPEGSFVTCDFKPQRVRLFVDESSKVAREPRIG
ncbi:subtilisin inhibitor 1 [Senna tora]|uniref:Subtilisin inhibitor 1 n=1 Tax=Senna tora TaxID=362788 RepID=A0A834TQ67_9FABA|nr:subtilisin inhibitor 1 [Senna tora]